MALFLFFFGLMLVFNFFHWSRAWYRFSHLQFSNSIINYLFGPLLLLYLDALRKKPRLQQWKWLHFIPALLLWIHMMPFFFSSHETKILYLTGQLSWPNGLLHHYVGYLIRYFIFGPHLIGYFIWMIYVYFQITQEDSQRANNHQSIVMRKRWLITIVSMYGAFVLSYLSYFLFYRHPSFSIGHDYLISAVMTISIYVIAYIGYLRPQIISGLHLSQFFGKSKYAGSNLTPMAADSLEQALMHHFENNKAYRRSDLKLANVAQDLHTSAHHISQVINDRFNVSFNQFVNQFRINEAKSKLADPSNEQEMIIQIAYEVGFNNKATFNAAFKKVTGISPSEWRSRGL